MVLEESIYGVRLIRRQLEEVTEATAAKNDLFTGAFRIVDRRARIDLGCPDSRQKTTGNWETWVESSPTTRSIA